MVVHQVLCAAGPVDAVTNQGLACRRRFARWGWKGRDVAAVLAPGMDRRAMRSLNALKPGRDDVLLVHYSGYAARLERLLDLPNPMVVISHNVTPARYFWAYEPIEGLRCALAPEQLAELARGARVAAGVSEYNAAELRAAGAGDVRVIPILFERDRLGAPGHRPPPGPPTVLFVGRLAPHKRQDLVIRAFGLYRRRHAPDARLVLVGTPLAPAFEASLRGLAEQVAPGAVSFERGLDDAALYDRYRTAHAFLCLSEHEGFCIPLLEAFHFGVPVVARDAGAISEVVGDAGVLLSGSDDVATVVELLRIVAADAELRSELPARGRRRLEAYDIAVAARRLRAAIEALSG
jgi:glycosyltransferase involved in cell wall biosynthesis